MIVTEIVLDLKEIKSPNNSLILCFLFEALVAEKHVNFSALKQQIAVAPIKTTAT